MYILLRTLNCMEALIAMSANVCPDSFKVRQGQDLNYMICSNFGLLRERKHIRNSFISPQ